MVSSQEKLIDADANLEGELLGQLITPEALRGYERRQARAANEAGRGGNAARGRERGGGGGGGGGMARGGGAPTFCARTDELKEATRFSRPSGGQG